MSSFCSGRVRAKTRVVPGAPAVVVAARETGSPSLPDAELPGDRGGGGRVVAGDQHAAGSRRRRTRGDRRRAPARSGSPTATRPSERRPVGVGRVRRPCPPVRRGDGEHPQALAGEPVAAARVSAAISSSVRRAGGVGRTPRARPCRPPGSAGRGPRCTVVIRRVRLVERLLGDPRPARARVPAGRARTGREGDQRRLERVADRAPTRRRSPSGGGRVGVVAQQPRPAPARRSVRCGAGAPSAHRAVPGRSRCR